MNNYYIYFDNEFIKQNEAKVPVLSATAQFGLNVFEGIRVYKETEFLVFRLQDHLDRLQKSMSLIGFSVCVIAHERIMEIIRELISLNNIQSDFSIRLTYLISETGSWSSNFNPTFFVAPQLKDRNKIDIVNTAILVNTRRISQLSMNPKIKCGANYINGRYALMEARHKGADLPIMKNHFNKISESSGSCVVLVQNGSIITPSIDCDILESITRDTIITILKDNNFSVEERQISEEELFECDEIFVCGSAAEVTPIKLVSHNEFRLGDVTRFVFTEYHKAVTAESYKDYGWTSVVNL
jgi:branched-chain amino acid aminotransferase